MKNRAKIQVSNDAKITSTHLGTICISKIENTMDEQLLLEDHAVILVGTPVRTVETWHNERPFRWDYKKGDMRFLPALTELTAHSKHPYSEQVVSIPDYWFRQISQAGIDYSSLDLRYVELPCSAVSAVTDAVVKVADHHEPPPILAESLALSITAAVARVLSADADRALKNLKHGLTAERKRRVIDYIEANINRPIGLGELAKVAALSPYHFSRSFKASLGVSPVSYLWERRVESAKQILAASNAKVSTVAYECGFTSQSHFTTKFKAITGKTPAEYRRAVKG